MDKRSAVLLLSLCWNLPAWAAQHLDSNTTTLLRRAPTLVVLVVKPETTLGAYLRTQTPQNDAALLYGAGGAALSGIMGSMIDAHRRNQIVEALQPYADIIAKQGFADQQYALIQQTFAQVPWLQKATWKQLDVTADDHRKQMSAVKATNAQAVLVLAPEVRLRNDVNQLMTDVMVDVYVRNPYAEDGYDKPRSSTLVAVSPQDPPDTYPPLVYTNTGQDDVTAKSLQEFFADGGVKLTQEFQGSLPGLKTALVYYFTGIEAPPAATH
jgi:hypothetical protein